MVESVRLTKAFGAHGAGAVLKVWRRGAARPSGDSVDAARAAHLLANGGAVDAAEPEPGEAPTKPAKKKATRKKKPAKTTTGEGS